MKKLLLISLVLVLGTTSLLATNNDRDVSEKELKAQIVQCLEKADECFESVMNIEMHFTFTSDGNIVVTKLSTSDTKVKRYIRENLNYHKFTNPGKRGMTYRINLKIQPV